MEEKKRSAFEIVKENSNYLRGSIKESLAEDTTHFTRKGETDLLKAHGTYQQDDRDKRQDFVKQKKEPAYAMMVRSKIPGGRLSAGQYLNHDELATRFGNGTLRITTRQGFQLHGVLKKNLKAVIRGINEKLGTTLGACGDNVRNVMFCPAPLRDREKSDLWSTAKAVSDQFLSQSGAYHEIWLNGEKVPEKKSQDPEPIYGKTYLPRKFKIAMAFPQDNCVDVYDHDIGIIPEMQNERPAGFNILVGGGLGMTHGIASTYPRLASPFCFVKADELLAITKAIVLVQRDYGNRADRKRARMKYLIDERGMDWFRQEVEKRFGKKTEPIHPFRLNEIDYHLGWHEEGGGRWFFGLSIENGRILDQGNFRLKSGLRTAVKKFRPGVFLTAQQDILLAGFKENQKKELEDLLHAHGIKLPRELSSIQKFSMACPALPTCGLAIAESERLMPSLVDELEQKAAELGLGDQKIMTRMTGCPNGCARPYNAELAFVGRTIGTYNIYVGGSSIGDRMAFLYAEKVPDKQLVQKFFPLLSLYQKNRQPDEAFGDFCVRMGAEKLKASAEGLPII